MNLTELEALAKLATPGQWDTNPDGVLGYELEVTANNHYVGICEAAPYDALYIAAANPDTIIKMIELIREMEEALRMSNNLSNPYHQEVDAVLVKYEGLL
jgi:hypothetical protein